MAPTRYAAMLRLAPVPVAAILALAACSEVQDNPLPPTGPAAKVHPSGWVSPDSDGFHGETLRTVGWDMGTCQTCHGADYAGGLSESSCLTCHPSSPEGCDVCHGGSGRVAPPEDTQGLSATSFPRVGAHEAHLSTDIAMALECGDCHTMFTHFDDPLHLDGDGRAEVTLGERAAGPEGLAAEYDPQTLTCANTYCHTGGRLGRGVAPVWNEVTGEACGSCHALPPPPDTEHPALDKCSLCHAAVVDEDRRIIDPSRHINGQTN